MATFASRTVDDNSLQQGPPTATGSASLLANQFRLVKLRHNEANCRLGFSLRGGKEATGCSVGVFVSHVEQFGEAKQRGLRPINSEPILHSNYTPTNTQPVQLGDQLVQVNGLQVSQATYEEVIRLIKQTPRGNDIHLLVNYVGQIPVQENQGDPIKWLQVDNCQPAAAAHELAEIDPAREQLIADTDAHDYHHETNDASSQRSVDGKCSAHSTSGSLTTSSSINSYNSDESGVESRNQEANWSATDESSGYHGRNHKMQLQTNEPVANYRDQMNSREATDANNNNTKPAGSDHSSGDPLEGGPRAPSSSAASTSSGCSVSISSSMDGSSAQSDPTNCQGPASLTTIRVPGGRRTSEPFGCGVVKGPDEWPGIFVQTVKPDSLAERVGFQPGDQLVQADDHPLDGMQFEQAIQLIKRLQQTQDELVLQVCKGAALLHLAATVAAQTATSGPSLQASRLADTGEDMGADQTASERESSAEPRMRELPPDPASRKDMQTADTCSPSMRVTARVGQSPADARGAPRATPAAPESQTLLSSSPMTAARWSKSISSSNGDQPTSGRLAGGQTRAHSSVAKSSDKSAGIACRLDESSAGRPEGQHQQLAGWRNNEQSRKASPVATRAAAYSVTKINCDAAGPIAGGDSNESIARKALALERNGAPDPWQANHVTGDSGQSASSSMQESPGDGRPELGGDTKLEASGPFGRQPPTVCVSHQLGARGQAASSAAGGGGINRMLPAAWKSACARQDEPDSGTCIGQALGELADQTRSRGDNCTPMNRDERANNVRQKLPDKSGQSQPKPGQVRTDQVGHVYCRDNSNMCDQLQANQEGANDEEDADYDDTKTEIRIVRQNCKLHQQQHLQRLQCNQSKLIRSSLLSSQLMDSNAILSAQFRNADEQRTRGQITGGHISKRPDQLAPGVASCKRLAAAQTADHVDQTDSRRELEHGPCNKQTSSTMNDIGRDPQGRPKLQGMQKQQHLLGSSSRLQRRYISMDNLSCRPAILGLEQQAHPNGALAQHQHYIPNSGTNRPINELSHCQSAQAMVRRFQSPMRRALNEQPNTPGQIAHHETTTTSMRSSTPASCNPASKAHQGHFVVSSGLHLGTQAGHQHQLLRHRRLLHPPCASQTKYPFRRSSSSLGQPYLQQSNDQCSSRGAYPVNDDCICCRQFVSGKQPRQPTGGLITTSDCFGNRDGLAFSKFKTRSEAELNMMNLNLNYVQIGASLTTSKHPKQQQQQQQQQLVACYPKSFAGTGCKRLQRQQKQQVLATRGSAATLAGTGCQATGDCLECNRNLRRRKQPISATINRPNELQRVVQVCSSSATTTTTTTTSGSIKQQDHHHQQSFHRTTTGQLFESSRPPQMACCPAEGRLLNRAQRPQMGTANLMANPMSNELSNNDNCPYGSICCSPQSLSSASTSPSSLSPPLAVSNRLRAANPSSGRPLTSSCKRACCAKLEKPCDAQNQAKLCQIHGSNRPSGASTDSSGYQSASETNRSPSGKLFLGHGYCCNQALRQQLQRRHRLTTAPSQHYETMVLVATQPPQRSASRDQLATTPRPARLMSTFGPLASPTGSVSESMRLFASRDQQQSATNQDGGHFVANNRPHYSAINKHGASRLSKSIGNLAAICNQSSDFEANLCMLPAPTRLRHIQPSGARKQTNQMQQRARRPTGHPQQAHQQPKPATNARASCLDLTTSQLNPSTASLSPNSTHSSLVGLSSTGSSGSASPTSSSACLASNGCSAGATSAAPTSDGTHANPALKRRQQQQQQQQQPAPKLKHIPCPPPLPLEQLHEFQPIAVANARTNGRQQQPRRRAPEPSGAPGDGSCTSRPPGSVEQVQQTNGNGSKARNRMCFVDELKMLAKRQQQLDSSAQTDSMKSMSKEAQDPSAATNSSTLIKIINASRSAATAGSGPRRLAPKPSSSPMVSGECSCDGRMDSNDTCSSCKTLAKNRQPGARLKPKSVQLRNEQDNLRRQHELLMKEFKSAHSKMFNKLRNSVGASDLEPSGSGQEDEEEHPSLERPARGGNDIGSNKASARSDQQQVYRANQKHASPGMVSG